MAEAAVVFDGVWKKFRRGERHDTLRDLVPSLVKRALGRNTSAELGEQEFWALKGVSFEVKPVEALGIIGPNGAGKSTTLKVLTRILKPTKGRCVVRGRVGALIEIAAGFHPDLTGRENVFLQGTIMGMRHPEILKHFDAIVEFAGLSEFIDTPVKRYSSGMNARLGFSIAAHLEPDVLLIDEVLAVGDFTFQQKCYERLATFKQSGVPIVLVSHNMQAIASLCTSALLLRPHEDPLLDDVTTVAGAYSRGQAPSFDPRLRLTSVRLVSGDIDAPMGPTVSPGERLSLSWSVQIREPLPRCGVLLHIVRSDGTSMFESLSTLDAVAPMDLESGVTLSARIQFTANLLRGIYTVHLSFVDEQRIWPVVKLGPVASFVVAETTRISGCTEMNPAYTFSVTDSGPVESAAGATLAVHTTP